MYPIHAAHPFFLSFIIIMLFDEGPPLATNFEDLMKTFSRLSSLPVYRCLNLLTALFSVNCTHVETHAMQWMEHTTEEQDKLTWKREHARRPLLPKITLEWLFSCLNKWWSFVCSDITTLLFGLVLFFCGKFAERLSLSQGGWPFFRRGSVGGELQSCFAIRWIFFL